MERESSSRRGHVQSDSDVLVRLDELISLADAAALSGISAHTLAQQAEKGKLRARKIGNTWVTTPRLLDEYFTTHARPWKRAAARRICRHPDQSG